jgi:4-amino-4-deoxy-L-arabinose transferase-like glycosyltransferase
VTGTVVLGEAWMSGDWRALAIGALLCGAGVFAIYRLRRWLAGRKPNEKAPAGGER